MLFLCNNFKGVNCVGTNKDNHLRRVRRQDLYVMTSSDVYRLMRRLSTNLTLVLPERVCVCATGIVSVCVVLYACSNKNNPKKKISLLPLHHQHNNNYLMR